MNAKEKVISGLFMVLFSAALYSQDITIEQVGHLAGWPGGFGVEDNYVFLATGPSLTVFDLSGTQIQQVASVALPSEPSDVFTSGSTAYAVDGSLRILDISDPEDASLLTTYEVSGVNVSVQHVYVSGNYAYVAADMGGLRVLDVSSPSSPVEVGSLAISDARRVFVLDNRAYVVSSGSPSKLWVVDVTSPASPASMGSCQVQGSNGIFVLGNTAYVACGWQGGIQIVDISDPASPTVESSYGAGSKYGYDVSAYSNYAYVAGSSGGLIVLDVTDPEAPTEVSVLTDIKANRIRIRYPSAYVVFGGDDGFRELDLSDPASPAVTRQFEMAVGVQSLYASGDRLYLSSYDRLWIYDLLAAPELPTPLSSYPEWQAADIFVRDTYAYLLDFSNIYILDVSDPEDVTQMGSLAGGGSGRIFVQDSYAYVVLGNKMEIIDVSDPTSPSKSGELTLSGGGDVFVPEGSDVAYVVDGGGLHAVDVSDPGAPGILASLGTSKDASCVWVSDSRAFVGSNSGGVFCIEAFDVSDPSSPSLVAKTDDDNGRIGDIEVRDGMILAAVSGHSGVYIYTLEDGTFTVGPRCQGEAYRITTYNPVPGVWYAIGGAESYGVDIQKVTKGEPTGEAVLVLGMGGQEAKIFPPDSSEEVSIAEARLTAQVDDWYVSDVVLTCEGNGKMSELKKAILYAGGRRIEGEVVGDGEGLMDYITFGVNKDIMEGETLSLMLYYKLHFPSCTDTAFIPCPLGEVKTYGVSYTIAQVDATPKHLQARKMLPELPTRLYSPVTTIGCVLVLESSATSSKTTQKIGSDQQNVILVKNKIQDAIDDIDYTDTKKYILSVFSGIYKENVNVNKSLTIRSKKGRNKTFVNAENSGLNVFTLLSGSTIIEGFTIKSSGLGDGIKIILSDVCIVKENKIDGNDYGVYLSDAKSCSLLTNLITNNTGDGIYIYKKSPNNIVKGNTISGNKDNGVYISGKGCKGNKILENFIGTKEDGFSKWPNETGIFITESPNNVIDKNSISGNKTWGVYIDKGASGNHIKGNYIGTDKTGTKCVPNESGGIQIYSADSNLIGGSDESEMNIISGNKGYGIKIEHAHKNEVLGNYIGTNKSWGSLPGQQQEYGISINGSENIIGGMMNVDFGLLQLTKANKIMFNKKDGIFIGSFSNDNRIQDNRIWKNEGHGIHIDYSSSNIILKNHINLNTGDGIFLSSGGDNLIKENLIYSSKKHGIECKSSDSNMIDWNSILGNTFGIYLIESKLNIISNNKIFYNEKGIQSSESEATMQGNYVKWNSDNTGIHLDNSSFEIVGNYIGGDEGDGILCENGSNPTIRRNNIFDNNGFGLNNTDPSVTINAQGNWWGDASGPGGEGSGAGDEVSGNVDFSNWRSEPVALVIFAGEDTVFVPSGSVDSVSCYFQNWQNLEDVLDINVVANPMSWLLGPTTFAVTLEDSMGASTTIGLTVPGDAAAGTSNRVMVTAVSQTDPSWTDADSFLVIAYDQALAAVEVSPDTARIMPGQTQQFYAAGYDSIGNSMDVALQWSATGGTVDSTGFYTAGNDTGFYQVTAEDTLSHVIGSAVVHITYATGVVEADYGVLPSEFALLQNYPNPFNPETTIRFDVRESARVVLKVYDMMGREVLTLVDAEYEQGRYGIAFDASRLSSGLYFYRIQMGGFCDTKKMVLLR